MNEKQKVINEFNETILQSLKEDLKDQIRDLSCIAKKIKNLESQIASYEKKVSKSK